MAPSVDIKEPVRDDIPKKIKHIQFSALSHREIAQVSQVEVVQRDLYSFNGGGREVVRYGALDRRMGPSEKTARCTTCEQDLRDCMGHFGHIKLALPIFHVGFFPAILTTLQNICKTCSKVLQEEPARRAHLKRLRGAADNMVRQRTLKAFNAACRKIVHCPYCNAVNGAVKKVGPLRIIHDKYRSKKSAKELIEFHGSFETAMSMQGDIRTHLNKAMDDLNPLKTLRLFENIPDEDCELLGMNPEQSRPEDYIWTYFPVPPGCMRPSVVADAQASNEDDLTIKLSEIIFTNAMIRQACIDGQQLTQIMEQWEFLQLTAALYINSEMPGIPLAMAASKGSRGLTQRLKGKQGRFRGNLSGKRVDFSGRTVISPDPNMRIDQVAVPVHVAKILTYPERATEHNIDKLRALIVNGPDVHPGANYVQGGSNGQKRFLKFGDRQFIADKLRAGDIVERHMCDGDVVLFNRQPSLHKLSIMSHFAKVMPWRTFRFNECFTLDARVLTNRGFMFRDEIAAALDEGGPLTFACYEVASKTIVYRPGKLVHVPNERKEVIHFGQPTTSGVSLHVTASHDMYVQTDLHDSGFSKQPASSLLPNQEVCTPCRACHGAVRFLAVAAGGVARADADVDALRALLASLGVATTPQLHAFAELYGYWLGAGSVDANSGMVYLKDAAHVRKLLMCLAVDEVSWSGNAVSFGDSRFSRLFHDPAHPAKRVADWATQCLTRDLLRLLLQGLQQSTAGGDGTTELRVSGAQFRDDLVVVMLLAGYTAVYRRAATAAGEQTDQWLITYTDQAASGQTQPVLRRKGDIDIVPYAGELWCVNVEHDDHLIFAQRAVSDPQTGVVTEASRPVIVGNCVCTPYNADFDGDEMNMHLPQTEEARAEALELMGVKNNLVTPRNGEPIIAATQDFITASYLLSRKDTFYTRPKLTQILSHMGDACMYFDIPPPCILKPQRLWSGKQILSLLMRPNQKSNVLVNLETKTRSYQKEAGRAPDLCPADGWLVIQNSEIMCGVWDKAIVGDGNKDSVFYVVLRDYGAPAAAVCMNRLAKLCARWLGNRGFSIGIQDVQPGNILSQKKEELVERGYSTCDDFIARSQAGKLENQPGCDARQTLEAHISGVLSKIRDDAGQICMHELNKYNAPLIMATCGSKGSKINVCQMVACVGQQIISGSRIPDGFDDRSLPHFLKNSKIPPAKGFVRNSFYSGLTPTEFFFHAVSGREGLIDTAVKTAETGYMQRRLMKALEDLTAHYDKSVRNSIGGIVQFTYGDDGLDPTNIEGDNKPVEFKRNLRHAMNIKAASGGRGLLPYEITENLVKETSTPDWQRHTSALYIDSVRDFVHTEITQRIAALRDKMSLPKMLTRGESKTARKANNAEKLQKRVDSIFRFTQAQLLAFVDICKRKYIKALIEPGTAVGAVGAQSIGEPGTQMTLKSVDWADKIVVCAAGRWQVVRIGQWIDQLMGCGTAPAKFIPPGQVEVLRAAPEPDAWLLVSPSASNAAAETAPCGHPQTMKHCVDAACPIPGSTLRKRKAETAQSLSVRHSLQSFTDAAAQGCAHVVLHTTGQTGGMPQLERALQEIDTLGWCVAQNQTATAQAIIASGALVVIAFGASSQREWRNCGLVDARSDPAALECGIAYCSQHVAADGRALLVVECPAVPTTSMTQMRIAVLAAQRGLSDPELLQRWSAASRLRQAKRLAEQQAAAVTYSNSAVERVVEADCEMGDTRLLDISPSNVFVPSVSPTGQISLSKVSSVTKHLPINTDGTRTVLRIRTRTGRVVSATKAKSFLTRVDGLLVATRGDQLKIGAYLPVNSQLPELDQYLQTLNVGTDSQLKQVPLDELSGFFFGAFLARGNSSRTKVLIANVVDDRIRHRLLQFAQRTLGDASTYIDGLDVRIQSSVLASLMQLHCGSSAATRCLPDFALSATDAFVSGLVDGFFSCCSRCTVKNGKVTIAAHNQEQALTLQLLLTRFGVFSELGQSRTLTIRGANAVWFARVFTLTQPERRAALLSLTASLPCPDGHNDDIPGCTMPHVQARLASKETQPTARAKILSGVISRRVLQEFLQSPANTASVPAAELQQLRDAVASPVFYDQVVSIEEVLPTAQYVYDLTVEGDKTFQMQDGLLMYDTFHFAGVASMNVTLGVPRIKEIINASKAISTPIITSKLVVDHNEAVARIVKGRVETTRLGDVAEYIEEVYKPGQCILNIRIDFEAIEKLQLEVSLPSIAQSIMAAPKLRFEGDVITVEPDIVRMNIVNKKEQQMYYQLQMIKRALPAVVIKGIPEIKRAVISDAGAGKFHLLAEGYGLRQVMATDGVVGADTKSNHVMEVEKVLGIEAARNVIIGEIQYTMGTHGMTIDPRHVMLLGDVMTYKGEVLGITRFGVSKMKDSVLMLASFEKTTDHLFDAAVYAKRDAVEGVSECIIMGIPMPIGTGMFKLIQRNDNSSLPPKRKLLFDTDAFHVNVATA
ncbi:DNA-directed RNA polymerase III subunit C1 (rpo31) [Sorochytrium milnesiophthora]